jgi:hypothetical protein
MQELLPLSKELATLGSTGLSILDYLGSGKTAPEDWVSAQRKELARFDKPMTEVMLAGARPVKILLESLVQKK